MDNVQCPNCGAGLEAPAAAAGKKGKCRYCHEVFDVHVCAIPTCLAKCSAVKSLPYSTGLVLSPDGSRLAFLAERNFKEKFFRLEVINTEDGSLISHGSYHFHFRGQHCKCTFIGNDRVLVTDSDGPECSLVLFDADCGEVVTTKVLPNLRFDAIDVHHESKRVAAIHCEGDRKDYFIIQVAGNRLQWTRHSVERSQLKAPAFSANGDLFYSTFTPERMFRFDGEQLHDVTFTAGTLRYDPRGCIFVGKGMPDRSERASVQILNVRTNHVHTIGLDCEPVDEIWQGLPGELVIASKPHTAFPYNYSMVRLLSMSTKKVRWSKRFITQDGNSALLLTIPEKALALVQSPTGLGLVSLIDGEVLQEMSRKSATAACWIPGAKTLCIGQEDRTLEFYRWKQPAPQATPTPAVAAH